MAETTGISVYVWTSQAELLNAKSGGTTLIAYKAKSKDSDIQIGVVADACEFVGDQVRVNTTLIRQATESLGKVVGDAMSSALKDALSHLT